MPTEQKRSDTNVESNDSAQKSVPLYLKVVDHIRSCILDGVLAERVLLTESRISAILGISRTPARQALAYLEQEHLVEKRTSRGYMVGSCKDGPAIQLTSDMLQTKSGTGFVHPVEEWEQIYEKIENEIIKLSILSRWRLNALALAETYACSRNTIQEVLSKLESRGVVVKGYQPRWTIIPLGENRLNEIFDVRSWLEPNLLAQAAPKIPSSILHQVIEKHIAALARFPYNTSTELNELEMDLHERLMQYADNKIALVALRSSKAGLISSKHVVASKEIPLGDDDPFIEEHLFILEALDRNNIDESRLRMLAHLLKSREKVSNRLKLFRSAARLIPETFCKSWATEILDKQ